MQAKKQTECQQHLIVLLRPDLDDSGGDDDGPRRGNRGGGGGGGPEDPGENTGDDDNSPSLGWYDHPITLCQSMAVLLTQSFHQVRQGGRIVLILSLLQSARSWTWRSSLKTPVKRDD